jgi:uncharacterized repeat protein (TIGR02543 family)
MKKFMEEAFKVFWIPVIMAIVSYIFFTLKDIMLGIIVLVALSAAYTLIRLYVTHKKWWLLIILMVVIVACGGAYFFRAPTISLTINGEKVTTSEISINGGKVQVSPAPKNGLYTKGTVITLTASAGSGQDWKSWVGTENDNTNPTTIKMGSSETIRVNFESRFSLIVNNQMVIGSLLHFTEGDISVSPAPDSDGKYTAGKEVSLSVHTNNGYDWKNWTGTSNDNSNPTSVIMSGGNKNVNVDFEGRFALIIDEHLVIGASMTLGNGSVNIDPAPGDDGKYSYGAKITLTATPDVGYGWKNWTGTSNDAGNPAIITINSDKHIAVSFEERYLVMVNNQMLNAAMLNFTGGKITATPAPGTDSRFTKNSIAMLTAVPAAGYRFDKWTGDVSDTVTAVSMIMNTNKSISATFIKIYNLTASVNVAAGGSVSPAKGTYDTGTLITLTAAPSSGYRFDKWTGDITGNTASVKVTVSDDVTATANFIKTWTLSVSTSPAEGGSVSPASGTYDDGTDLVLIATPATGYDFEGWTGGASGNATSANITMNSNKTITAKFILKPVSDNTTSNNSTTH